MKTIAIRAVDPSLQALDQIIATKDNLRLVDAIGQRNSVKAANDTTLLRLTCDFGLRRSEVVGLQFADVDLTGKQVTILGRGELREMREWPAEEFRARLQGFRCPLPGMYFAASGSHTTAHRSPPSQRHTYFSIMTIRKRCR